MSGGGAIGSSGFCTGSVLFEGAGGNIVHIWLGEWLSAWVECHWVCGEGCMPAIA